MHIGSENKPAPFPIGPLAGNAGHAWYERIDFSRIDLGKGKRQISPGGRLDKAFLITVPESFANVA